MEQNITMLRERLYYSFFERFSPSNFQTNPIILIPETPSKPTSTFTASSECEILEAAAISGMEPWKATYADEDVAELTCQGQYVVSWATSTDDVSQNVKCKAGSWVPEPAVDDFSRAVGCVGGFLL